MTDFASLVMKIDTTSLRQAADELDKLQAAGQRAEKASENLQQTASKTGLALRNVGSSAGLQRAGMQQLSFQIGDVAQQFALGTKPMVIFAQQGGQVIQAIQMMRTSTGGLIGFLAGPWGAAITGAALILGSLATSHEKAGSAAKDQEDAARDLKEAIDKLYESTVRQTQSTYASANAMIVDANAKRANAIETRNAALAELQLAKAKAGAANATANAGGGPSYFTSYNVGAAGVSESKVRDLDKQIKELNSQIGKTEATIRLQRGIVAGMQIEEKFDKAAAAQGKFNRRQDELNKLLGAGKISLSDYRSELTAATATRIKEEEAANKSAKTHKAKKAAMTDEQRAYEQAKKAADSFIESLDFEIQKIGKTEKQIRLLEIARAREKAATADQKSKIEELGQAREAALAKEEAAEKRKKQAKEDSDLIGSISRELALLGLRGEAYDRAALAIEVESLKARALSGDINLSADAIERYKDLSLQLIEGESALAREAQAARDLLDGLYAISDQASVTGEALSSAFGGIGEVLGGIVTGMADYQAEAASLADQVRNKTIEQGVADKQLATLRARNTATALAGMKGLFKEHSTGYKIMSAVEKAYALFQLANTIKAIALDSAHTATSVANSTTRAAADQAAGASKIFSQLGVFAFPVVAAMIALLASLGVKGGKGGGGAAPPSAQDLQDAAGTGSVLGDSKAKSDSIANSLEIVAANTNRDLEYSNQMLRALRSIDFSIGKLAGTVARQITVSGSLFDTSGLNLGSSGSGGFLGIGKKSTTRTLYDLGLILNSGSLESIINGGISGQTYQTVQKVKKKSGFFGIGGGTKTSYSTTYGTIDAEITAAIQDVLISLRDGLVTAADVIGLEGAEAILNAFQVNLGQISFKDMTGEQIEEQLNAIFSKVGDDMAGAVFPALKEMQLIGEGLFETFMRVAREYQVVDIALKSIGKEFGAVGVNSVKARDALVQLFGDLETFVERTDFFRDQFLTEAEQIAPIAASVRAEMIRLGLAGVTTREQFKQTVLGLDLTTAAGREMYAALLAVAPAFDKTLDYLEKANKATIDGLQKTIDQFTKFAESLRKYRDTLFLTDAAQGNAYALLKRRFIETAGLAAGGDATALGGLENAGKAFLDSAKANASSRQDYLRDVALVARGVDQGIFAAESVADYAQLQLDALQNAVAILGQIETNTAPSPPVSTPQSGAQSLPANETRTPVIEAQNDTIIQQNGQIITLLTESNRLWKRWDGDGLPEERTL